MLELVHTYGTAAGVPLTMLVVFATQVWLARGAISGE